MVIVGDMKFWVVLLLRDSFFLRIGISLVCESWGTDNRVGESDGSNRSRVLVVFIGGLY